MQKKTDPVSDLGPILEVHPPYQVENYRSSGSSAHTAPGKLHKKQTFLEIKIYGSFH